MFLYMYMYIYIYIYIYTHIYIYMERDMIKPCLTEPSTIIILPMFKVVLGCQGDLRRPRRNRKPRFVCRQVVNM